VFFFFFPFSFFLSFFFFAFSFFSFFLPPSDGLFRPGLRHWAVRVGLVLVLVWFGLGDRRKGDLLFLCVGQGLVGWLEVEEGEWLRCGVASGWWPW